MIYTERKPGEIVITGEEIRIFGSFVAQVAFSKNDKGSLGHLPPNWQQFAFWLRGQHGFHRTVMKDGTIVVWTDQKNKDAITAFADSVVEQIMKHIATTAASAREGEPEQVFITNTPVRRGSKGYYSTNSRPEDFGRFASVVRAIRAEREFLDTASDEERMEHYRLTAAAPRTSLLNLPGTTPTAGSHRTLVCATSVQRAGDSQHGYYAGDARVL